MLHGGIKAVSVQGDALLLGHLRSQIDRKAEGVVQEEGLVSRDAAIARLGFVGGAGEHDQTAIERLEEGLFLLFDDRSDIVRSLDEFWKGAAQRADDRWHQTAQQWFLGAERLPRHPDAAAQDSSKHEATSVRTGQGAIGHRHDEAADVVCDDSVGHIGVAAHAACVGRRSGFSLNRFEDGCPQVGVVVAADTLQYSHDSLEPHAGIHMLGRQWHKCSVLAAVVLNEHQIPEFDDVGMVEIDQRTARVVGR